MRISATSRSSSVCADTLGAHSFRLDDPGHRDDVVAANDERPRLACRTWDLCVDEHVLDLLRASGEPVTGTPRTYLKAWHVSGDAPVAPADLAVERHRRALEPDVSVLPHRGETGAGVEPLRARCRREQVVQRGRLTLGEAQQVPVGRRMQRAQAREDLGADQAALRVGVRRVAAKPEPVRAAVLLRLLAPELEQRAHDAVLAHRLYSLRGGAGDEPVEHRLDLVRGRVPGGAQTVG